MLPWLAPGQAFPPVENAWGEADPAPGLLAAGGVLDVATLIAAYAKGIFPWYSAGQPTLWWSTHPRMVLQVAQFRLHRSLRKSIRALLQADRLDIRMDHDVARVIQACAHAPRDGQQGTWILPEMAQAYIRLASAGAVHSVETWIDGELAGGLYAVNLGRMVFGESMFSRQSLQPRPRHGLDRLPARDQPPGIDGSTSRAARRLLPPPEHGFGAARTALEV
jgi:leucyl/phenylalanyl-tRNA--protein transferase